MSIEVVFEKRINNANVCRDVDMAQRRQYFLLTLLASMFVLGLLLYGWQHYRWVSLGFEIGKATERKDALLDYQNHLVLERDVLAAPGRIQAEAMKRGLGPAVDGQIVTLAPGELGPYDPTNPMTASAEER